MKTFFCYICFALPALLLSCVAGKTKLSDDDLKWINVYSVGDSLIFRSEKGEYDTSVIIKQETFYTKANPIETGKYHHQWGHIVYKNKKLKYETNGEAMITLIRSDPPSPTRLYLKYLNTIFSIDPISDAQKFRKENIYEFDAGPKKDSSTPRIIFWHEQKGLIKYITQAGIVWERVNI